MRPRTKPSRHGQLKLIAKPLPGAAPFAFKGAGLDSTPPTTNRRALFQHQRIAKPLDPKSQSSKTAKPPKPAKSRQQRREPPNPCPPQIAPAPFPEPAAPPAIHRHHTTKDQTQ